MLAVSEAPNFPTYETTASNRSPSIKLSGVVLTLSVIDTLDTSVIENISVDRSYTGG